MQIVRMRRGWFGRVRVTVQDNRAAPMGGPERWRASFRYIWDAKAFADALCTETHFEFADSDYCYS